jgi:hypothetical protein
MCQRSKSIIRGEEGVCLLLELEEGRAETVSFGSEQGRRRRVIVCYEDDGFWVNEEF